MPSRFRFALWPVLALALAPLPAAAAPPTRPTPAPVDPLADFEAWTGARLLFTRNGTAPEVLYATTPELDAAGRRAAARILAAEARHYPKGALAAIGLKTVSVFAGCGDPDGDGYRPWVDSLNGYRYFGRWHRVGAIAACYYTDSQLPLTFHHEVFHHVDASKGGQTTSAFFTEDDARFADAVSLARPYPALDLDPRTLDALRAVSTGEVLEESVGKYSEKGAGEDQAETARWFQGHLADGLIQAAQRPELAGSQRILHLLREYKKALPSLTAAWFASVALGESPSELTSQKGSRDEVEARPRTPRVAPDVQRDNPYLAKVDAEIADPAWRKAIRQVQPATVRLGGGSGVNIDPSGLILTAGHVSDNVGDRFTVAFPDGRTFKGVTIASDHFLDLGLVRLEGARDLPIAALAAAAPEVGDPVAIVGQPGTRTPGGEPTGYQPWHVSVGEIRGFLPDILGKQSLGRTKHDAWTYWGHSGSPLFDTRGRIIALHNSWDSKTAMRHAVPWEAIRLFLSRNVSL